MLKNGAAKLRRFADSPKNYQQAEHLAVTSGNGLWSTLPKLTFDSIYKPSSTKLDPQMLPVDYDAPDLGRAILVSGAAMLRDLNGASEAHRDAQMEAIVTGRGMWINCADLDCDRKCLESIDQLDASNDSKLAILNNGCARLKVFAKGGLSYRNAEHVAIVTGRGMWSIFLKFQIDPQYTTAAPKLFPIDYDALDVAREVLANGIAKISNPKEVPVIYRKAEDEARSNGKGLWPMPRWWETTSVQVLLALGGFVGLGGFAEFYNLLKGFRNRKSIVVLFMGRPSTGKSWVWARLEDPEISRSVLEGIDKTEGMRKGEFPLLMRGEYTLLPTCIDTAGNDPATIVRESLTPRRWFNHLQRWTFPKKYIWLIMLSTVERKGVARNSPDSEKVNDIFIAEQLGYMDLPKGLIQANGGRGPIAVFFCITKVDLFFDSNPKAGSMSDRDRAEFKQLSNRFDPHINAVKAISSEEDKREAKEDRRDPIFYVVYISAAEGWGLDILERKMNECIFQGRPNRG